MKKRTASIFGIIISLLILVIPLVYVIRCKTNSYIISEFFILVFILPFVIAIIPSLIKRTPAIIKIGLPIVVFIMSAFFGAWLNGVGGNGEFRVFNGYNEVKNYYENFDIYEQYDEWDGLLSEYGEYENITLYYYHHTGIFQQRSDTTILKYDKKNFENQIKYIEENYFFYTEPVLEDEPEPIFNFEGFDFKIVDNGYYPKYLYMIGINNESSEIAYVTFEDYDLDCVFDFASILESDCGWAYIIDERAGALK